MKKDPEPVKVPLYVVLFFSLFDIPGSAPRKATVVYNEEDLSKILRKREGGFFSISWLPIDHSILGEKND